MKVRIKSEELFCNCIIDLSKVSYIYIESDDEDFSVTVKALLDNSQEICISSVETDSAEGFDECNIQASALLDKIVEIIEDAVVGVSMSEDVYEITDEDIKVEVGEEVKQDDE